MVVEEEEDLVRLVFRLYDGMDMGPFEYPSTTTIAAVKQTIVDDWPNDKEMVPMSVNEIKLIHAGKILDSDQTVGRSRMSFADPEQEAIIMHVVLQPFTGNNKSEKNSDKTPKCTCASCSIM
uniref:Membrane-anchored ubiquitin-fold protein n=1 Tax=Kalanchoe fedtschenkoi TaxID=63787 RepID=A0A7N0ZSN9_KALFE